MKYDITDHSCVVFSILVDERTWSHHSHLPRCRLTRKVPLLAGPIDLPPSVYYLSAARVYRLRGSSSGPPVPRQYRSVCKPAPCKTGKCGIFISITGLFFPWPLVRRSSLLPLIEPEKQVVQELTDVPEHRVSKTDLCLVDGHTDGRWVALVRA